MLRVGILLPSLGENKPELHAWTVALIRRMEESAAITLAVVAMLPPQEPATQSLVAPQSWGSAAFRVYQQWDRRRAGIRQDALADASLADLPTAISILRLNRDPVSWASALESYGLDVLLWLDTAEFRIVPEAARLGTWLLDVAETWRRPELPPLWREHTRGQVVTTRLLHFANEVDAPRVLYTTRTAVDPFSFAQTSSPVYWKAVEVVMRSLERFSDAGPAMLSALEGKPENGLVSNRFGMASFLRAELQRRVQSRSKSFHKATFAKWCMGLRKRNASMRFDDPSGYRLMVSPRDRFYADPFLFEHQGRTWLFFEDFRYGEGRAVISCCEVSADGEPQEIFEVLRLPYHLSYPFVFEHEGAIYMIPESRGNRTVSMYRAVDFPARWEHDTDLFADVDMVDTTLHCADGRWWMFAGVSNGSYSNSDELCIYFADQLRGPFTPHPQNPVVSDVRRARPAGRLFHEDGRLIRPSQDCGPAYGYGLVFSEIEELTPEIYRERVMSELLPESVPGNTANHTYTRTAKFEVIDRFFVESRLGEAETFPQKQRLTAAIDPSAGEGPKA